MSTSPSSPYTLELQTALRAVHLTSLLTKSHLLHHLSKSKTSTSTSGEVTSSTKSDSSEVTTADFASQAIIISIIHHIFPEDGFIAEESADMLRGDEELCDRVWGLVGGALRVRDGVLGQGDGGDGKEEVDGGLKMPGSKEEMLDLIDLGQKGGVTNGNGGDEQSRSRKQRTWILDPIDGTKTYIRGQQYAVCLCLVEDGEQQVGVLGCPNLNLDQRNEQSGRVRIEEGWVDLKPDGGWILSTIKGSGVKLSRVAKPWELLPLEDVLGDDGCRRSDGGGGVEGQQQAEKKKEEDENTKPTISLRFTDSAASPHVSKDLHNRVFQHFAPPPATPTTTTPDNSTQSSSSSALDIWSMQLKYVLLTLRAHNADALIRVPPASNYHAAVWDHAGGQLLLTESGGVLTDANGREFVVDGRTRKLEGNWGVCGIRGGAGFGNGKGKEMVGKSVHGVLLRKVLMEVERRG